jgi:hypothetical protein
MAKQKMKEIIEAQPDDASYEEIIREFAFERMIEKGLDDIRNGRVISDEEMRCRFAAMAVHSSGFTRTTPIKTVRAEPVPGGSLTAMLGPGSRERRAR